MSSIGNAFDPSQALHKSLLSEIQINKPTKVDGVENEVSFEEVLNQMIDDQVEEFDNKEKLEKSKGPRTDIAGFENPEINA
mgnify:CR=1 FL=1|jgi:hypothetical protein